MSESRVALLRRAAESNATIKLGDVEVDGDTAKSLVALYDSLEGNDQEAMAEDLYKNPERAVRIAQSKNGICPCCGGNHGELPPIVAGLLGALFGGTIQPKSAPQGGFLSLLVLRPKGGSEGAGENKP